jgi:hypothetical protein
MFKKKEKPKPEGIRFAATEDYLKWRQAILGVKPGQAGVSEGEKDRVYGVVMDFGMSDQDSGIPFALSTTIFANGESSFRPSPGGGFLGLGNDPNIEQAAREMTQLAQTLYPHTTPVKDAAFPKPGFARFYFLTTSGLRLYEEHVNKIQAPQHPFGRLLNGFGYIRTFAEKANDQKAAENK